MNIPTIAVYNQSSVVGDKDVDKACQAIDKQVKNHVFNAWGLTANVVFMPNTTALDPTWWRVLVLDTSDIAQAQFVAQKIMAGNGALLGFRARALALDLALGNLAPGRHRFRHCRAQVEVAADAFAARTDEGEE